MVLKKLNMHFKRLKHTIYMQSNKTFFSLWKPHIDDYSVKVGSFIEMNLIKMYIPSI